MLRYEKYKRFLALALVSAMSFTWGCNLKQTLMVNAKGNETEIIIDDSELEDTQIPTSTQTPEVAQTPVTTKKPSSQETPKPVKNEVESKDTRKKIATPKKVELTRHSAYLVKVSWSAVKGAKKYNVYYKKKKKNLSETKFKLEGHTENTHFMLKKLKNKSKYVICVRAVPKNKKKYQMSKESKSVSITVKKHSRLTVIAGDSITADIMCYGILGKIKIPGRKKVVAATSLNTTTFRTKRVFNGQSGISKVISLKPDRVYFMLGINEIHYMPLTMVLKNYETLVKMIKAASPKTDIVILGISPATSSLAARTTGYNQVPKFNKLLAKQVKKWGETVRKLTV